MNGDVFPIHRLRLLLLSALCACGSDVPPPPSSWDVVVSEHKDGLLLSVWAPTSEEVWVVGGRTGTTTVLQGNATGLWPIETPGSAMAWWVCGVGDGVVVVGEAGLVMRKRKDAGFERIDVGVRSSLFGCWGTSPEDFWVVGGDPVTGPAEMVHVTAEGIAAPNLGPIVPRLPRVLYKIWGHQGRIVAVGDEGAILMSESGTLAEWVLQTWGSGEPLFTVHGNADGQMWAVGGLGAPLALRWRDGQWHADAPDVGRGLSGIAVGPGGDLISVGQLGLLVERLEGAPWEPVVIPTARTLHAVAMDGAGGAWAVGGNIEESDPNRWRGVVLHRPAP